VNLLAAGALDRCTTFPVGIDIRLIERLHLPREDYRLFHEDNLRALEMAGGHRRIARAIRRALARSRRPEQLRALIRTTVPGLVPILRRIRAMLPGAGARRGSHSTPGAQS